MAAGKHRSAKRRSSLSKKTIAKRIKLAKSQESNAEEASHLLLLLTSLPQVSSQLKMLPTTPSLLVRASYVKSILKAMKR